MRDGIVGGEDEVELVGVMRRDLSHVGDGEGDVESAFFRFKASAVDGGGGEVGSGDLVAKRRETQCLGADATGNIEDRQWAFSPVRAKDGIDSSGLAVDAGVPIGEDEVVEG